MVSSPRGLEDYALCYTISNETTKEAIGSGSVFFFGVFSDIGASITGQVALTFYLETNNLNFLLKEPKM